MNLANDGHGWGSQSNSSYSLIWGACFVVVGVGVVRIKPRILLVFELNWLLSV